MVEIFNFRSAGCLLAGVLLLAGCDSADAPEAVEPAAEIAAQSESDGHEGHAAGEELGTVDFPVSCSPDAQAEFNRADGVVALVLVRAGDRGLQEGRRARRHLCHGPLGRGHEPAGQPLRVAADGPALIDGPGGGRAGRGRRGRHTPRARPTSTPSARSTRTPPPSIMRRGRRPTPRPWGSWSRSTRTTPRRRSSTPWHSTPPPRPPTRPMPTRRRPQRLLERIAVAQPDHPGVAHYLIHTYDYPARAGDGLKAAERYSKIAPVAPHALHMPSHIFTRLGDWDASIASNSASAKSAKDELTAGHAAGRRLLQRPARAGLPDVRLPADGPGPGRQGRARRDQRHPEARCRGLRRCLRLRRDPGPLAFERGQWNQAAKLTLHPANLDWKRFPQAEAVNAFARGLGAARNGDAAAAGVEMATAGRAEDRHGRGQAGLLGRAGRHPEHDDRGLERAGRGQATPRP